MKEGGYTFWGSWMGPPPPQPKLCDMGDGYDIDESLEDKERRLNHLYDSLEIDPTSMYKAKKVSGAKFPLQER